MANSWFVYTSGPNSDPQSYTFSPAAPSCPEEKAVLCAIFAEIQLINGVKKPIITPALQSQITTAVQNVQESANVLLRPN